MYTRKDQNVNPPYSGSFINGRFWDPLGRLQK
jgi:hypothetical protein